ncbi:diguanylate cyclase (GGDEF)-like protein/PAS domain S-box-containing protein [Bacillus niacini]|uniref:Diguanylate cyclase (GGDEF)-like protein/PAS domain S-box-containing protein n=1 Tax=Neobacillus niacini TaxID=86668 RepID=A0A852T805_9BACI|nr:sensor domain-containing diguanylate cyclase [Neobacillus niacini]NYE03927.1 diguanylate cyclase (GGDEF)-like protein/PAS domain S-box-containing protein [Neobacillus niacini]
MKFTGRITLLLISIMVSIIESFSEPTTIWSILEAILFAAIAAFLGWVYDNAIYYKNKAEISESRLSNLLKLSPEPIMVYQDEKIVFVNDKFEELVDSSSGDILGKSIYHFVLPEYHPTVRQRFNDMILGNKSFDRVEIKIISSNHNILDIEISSAPILYNDKPAIEVFLRDVTKRNKLSEEVRKNTELYRFITENTTDLISFLNPNGEYEYLSPSSKDLLDFYPEEMIGKNLSEFLHPGEIEKVIALLLEADEELDFAAFSHRTKKKDGSYMWMETNARTIRKNSRKLEGIVAVSRDITERLEKEERLHEANVMLRYISNMDGLTGIPNRRYFDEKLQEEWKRLKRNSSPFSAIMIDIDFFKKYNDFNGHQAGDECLRLIASVLKNTVRRAGDFAARYGGEEFVILLPETDAQGAVHVAELLQANVRDLNIPYLSNVLEPIVSISIGCSTLIPDERTKPEELIKLADKELYKAKESRRNQLIFNQLSHLA